jgi:glyoxylase-like metal-dependent hydrolase (beta-lactamase superfamily II)
VKLTVMCSGFLHFDRSVFTYGEGMGVDWRVPSLMFLIEHPDGRVLFETGLDERLADDAAGYWGEGTAGDLRPEVRRQDTIVPQLARLGLTPEDIGHVVMSCLYQDHAGGLKHFGRSRVIVQRCELQEAWWPTRGTRATYRDPYKLVDVEGTRDFDFVELDGQDYDIFGDGSVLVLSVPCHAKGEQALLVRMPSGRRYLMPAGAIPTRPNLESEVMTGCLMVTPDEAYRSVSRLKEVARLEGATVLLHHDPDAWRTYRLAPESYD